MMEQNQYNVSVRFNYEDKQKLDYLLAKFSKRSYGKVSLADVLRTALNELYVNEFSEDVPKEEAVKETE